MKGRTTMAAKGKSNGTDKSNDARVSKRTRRNSKKPDAAGETKKQAKQTVKTEQKSNADAAGPKKSKRLLEWEEPEKLILVEGWARDGLSEKQIAHNMGCAYSTFKLWKNTSSALLAALKKGKEVSDYLVENALFTSALSGNVVAQIFWLKNRKPENWQDRVEKKVEIDTEDAGGVLMIAPRLEVQDE